MLLEDTAELAPLVDHLVRLEARPASNDGVAAISVEQLLHTALRLRPDRLVVGEVRGPEVLGLVQALNTGHDGSWSTCHANSALDALHRLETLVVQTAPAWPLRAVRDHLLRCIDAVVHVERAAGGARRVSEIAEVVDGDGVPATRPIVIGGERVGDAVARSRCRAAMTVDGARRRRGRVARRRRAGDPARRARPPRRADPATPWPRVRRWLRRPARPVGRRPAAERGRRLVRRSSPGRCAAAAR